jgi:hypothetical protein
VPYKLCLQQYNLQLLSFNTLFIEQVERQIINDLHKYQLLTKKLTNGDIKKLFIHHIFFSVCEQLLKEKALEKSILYYNISSLSCRELYQYFEPKDVQKLIKTIINKIKRLLPVRFYENELELKELEVQINKKSGISQEIINNIRYYVDSYDTHRFTFSKIRLYAKKNGLTFLSKEYFNTLKIKHLVLV